MEIMSENRRNFAKRDAIKAYVALFTFGVAYDQIVGYLEEKSLDDGYTSDLVVVGTAVTLLGALPLIGLKKTALTLGAFVASGLPMAVGSKLRYRRRRKREGIRHGNGKREWYTAGNGRQGTAAWEQPKATAGCSGASANGRAGGIEQHERIT